MTALIVIGSIAAYLTIGSLYARAMVVDTYRRCKAEWSSESSARESLHLLTGFRLACWPGFMVFDGIRGGVGSWLLAPVNDRKQQAETLRQDAKAWRAKQHEGTPAEREMATELARMCEDRAHEVDL